MRLNYFFGLFIALFITTSVKAEVNLLDKDDWKVGMSGFMEFDATYDTTRSLLESPSNAPIARKGTFAGDNGRTQFSIRNSRLAFNVVAPETNGWKSRGYLETDFLGYEPSTSITGPTESAYFSNPTLRIRHAYLSTEKNGWNLLLGQTWSLFGWQPEYVLATFAVNPVAGVLYQRTQKIGVIHTMSLDDTCAIQTGVALERPTQRDGKIPNVEAAIRWIGKGRTSGFNGSNADIKTQPMSLGISGAYRRFSSPNIAAADTATTTNTSAYALALDALIPVIASSDGKDVSNTLTLTGEFTAGKGYGDELASWTGGLGQNIAGTAFSAVNNAANINLDPGLGGYTNAAGNFELLNLHSWSSQLQYHFDAKTFFTAGYGQLFSSNVGDFVGAPTNTTGTNYAAAGLYDHSESAFLNLGHDCTSHIRMGLEVSQHSTHYLDGGVNHDNRYMFASFFRF